MTKAMTKNSKTETSAPTAVAAMMAFSPAAVANWTEMMNECARFATDRFQQDLETQQAMLACRNPMDFFKLQSEFYQRAVLQYTEEATRLFQMMTGTDARLSFSRAYDDVPL